MEGNELDLINAKKVLKIVHVNTRSVFHKMDELKRNLNKFNVIVFSESGLNNSADDSQLSWEFSID